MKWIARALLFVLALPLFAADDPRWLTDLDSAKQRALRSRKPILCVLLASGNSASKKLEREFTRSKKLAALLDRFVCVKLEKADETGLTDKYGLKHSPATVFFTFTGAPMKTIVGPVSTGKYISQTKAALEKHATIWRPKRPEKVPPKPPPPVRSQAPRVYHTAHCPTGCEPCKSAVSAALGWLARRQKSDGRLGKPKSERVTKTDDGRNLTRSIDHVDVVLTAMAGLAFLADGSTPTRGPHRREITRARDFLAGAVRPDGIVSPFQGNDHLYLTTCNFETAFAAMFLAEIYALHPDPDLRERLERIAKYFAGIQDPMTGAWGYSNDYLEHHPFVRRGWRLLATTHCCLTALNSIRDAGIPVDEAVVRRAAGYLRACRGRDGAFVYRAEYRVTEGSPGATAGALFALSRSRLVGAETLASIRTRHRKHFEKFDEFGKHWWFFLLFTGLAMNDRGEGAVRAFDREFRDAILHEQKDDGHWEEPDGNGGSVFSTAVGALVLSLRSGRLPVFSARRPAPVVEPARSPTYVKPPSSLSRVKVFPHEGGYRLDLVVSIDGPADDAYVNRLKGGLIGANRTLYDVTDGQMSMSTVEIHTDRGRWDDADILVSREFRAPDVNPYGFASGITRISKKTEVVRGREVEGKAIGDWIMFPYHEPTRQSAMQWDNPRMTHVLAHEICHYLFGAKDEYNTMTGESYCDCIMGKRRATELCRDKGHTDTRQKRSCATLARGLYPRLRFAEHPDPGPWDPPVPAVRIVR